MEEAPVIAAEPETVEIITEATPEAVIAEPAVQEIIVEAPVITEAAPIEQPTVAVEEAPAIEVEAPAETIAPTEPVAEAPQEQTVVEAPLQAFEVTEQAPIETTLEKVLEEPVIEPVSGHLGGGGPRSSPPFRSASAGAFGSSDSGSGHDNDQTPPAEENDENTTE